MHPVPVTKTSPTVGTDILQLRSDLFRIQLGISIPVVDAATAKFYSLQASEIALRYESVASPVARFFGAAFAIGSRVLDIGAGSGRDLSELLTSGFDAYGVEPSEALATLAVAHHPELTGRIARGALPQIGEPFGGGFDGILCSAVLMLSLIHI